MKKLIPALALPLSLSLAACTSGQGAVDVTATNVATFPGAPAQAQALQSVTVDSQVTIDAHDELVSMSNLGTLTDEIQTDAISGADLSFVQHVRVTLATEDGVMPEQVLSDVDLPPSTTQFDLPRLMGDDVLLQYFSEGKVTVHLSVTGTMPTRPLEVTHTLVAHLSVAVNGSVLKF